MYNVGSEPDVRFSFANERTFLAWIRTSLALLAGGVALDALDVGLPRSLGRSLSALLVVLGLYCAILAWLRWARAERAIRQGTALPGAGMSIAISVGVATAAIVLLTLM